MTIEIHELDITDGLNKMLYDELKKENKKLKKKLDIAVKALDSLRGICFPQRAEEALEQIEELDK